MDIYFWRDSMNLKKWISAFVIAVLTLSLASCSDVKVKEFPEEETGTVSESTTNPDEAKYNINDFVGEYGNGRGGIDIKANGNDYMTVKIHWASSAWEWSDWTMSGSFDAAKGVLEYSDGVLVSSTASDEGETDSKEEYNNGTGRFIFKREDNVSSLIWEDDMVESGRGEELIRSEPADSMYVGLWETHVEDTNYWNNGNGLSDEEKEQYSKLYIKLNEDFSYSAHTESSGDEKDGTWSIETEDDDGALLSLNGEYITYNKDKDIMITGMDIVFYRADR